MAMASSSAGGRLLRALVSAGCPDTERLKGEDLDWMMENEDAREWLERLGVEMEDDPREMVLTREEAKEWEGMRQERPDKVLHGRALEEALKSARLTSADLDASDLPSLRARAAALGEELSARDGQPTAHARALTSMETRTSLGLSRRNKCEEAAGRHLRARQEDVLRESARWDEALEGAAVEVEKLFRRIEDTQLNMFHKCQMDKVAREDAELLDIVQSMVQKQFSESDDQGWVSHVTEEAREKHRREASRCIAAIKVSAKEVLSATSMLAGSKAANAAFDSSAKRLLADASLLDPLALGERIAVLESRASSLQRDLSAMSSAQLDEHADLVGNSHMNDLEAMELQRELHRSLYHEKKLRLLTDTLLSQRARQCVISLLEHQEQERLRRLLAILSEFASTCERWRAERDREVSSLSRLSAFVAEKNRSAVLPRSDLLLNSLLKLLHDKEGGYPSQRKSPQSELLSLLEALLAEKHRAEEACDGLRWEMEHLRRGLERRLADIHARSRRGGEGHSSSSSRVWVATGELQRSIRAFELAVMSACGQWDAEKRRTAASAEERTQRRLWVDFLVNPKVLEANVEAMTKKAALISSGIK